MSYGKERNQTLVILKCGGVLLIARAIRCAFVGYAQNSKAYRLLDLESNVIIVSREVEFFENMSCNDINLIEPTQTREPQEETPKIVGEQPQLPRRRKRLKDLGSSEKCSQIETPYPF